MGTVAVEEKEQFEAIRSRLMALLENQITHFRYEHLLLARQSKLFSFIDPCTFFGVLI